MISKKLDIFLENQLEHNADEKFVSGKIIEWCASRFFQFFIRKVSLAIFSAARYLICFYAFAWFSWHDFIYFMAVTALVVGMHYGALESYRRVVQSKAKLSPTDIRNNLSMAKIMTWLSSLFLFGFLMYKSRFIFLKHGYVPNVFDEARLLVIVRAISQIFRNLDVAIQSKKGIRPIRLSWLWSMEIGLTVLFWYLIQFLGSYPGTLAWILLIDAVLIEGLFWGWLIAERKVSMPLRLRWSDLEAFPLFLKMHGLRLMLNSFSGLMMYAERFILIGFMAGLLGSSIATYYIFLPFTVLVWRLPHSFARYFRADQSFLKIKMGLVIFMIVFFFECILSFALFMVFKMLPIRASEGYEKLITMLVLLGPVAAFFAYVWYSRKLSWVLVWCRRLIGQKPLRVEFTHRVPLDLPAGAEAEFGKRYIFWTRRSKMQKLKNKLFAISVGDIQFDGFKKTPLLQIEKKQKVIPLGSALMRTYISDSAEIKTAIQAIRTSLQRGSSKRWKSKKYQFVFGLNSFGWPVISIQRIKP